MLEAVTGEQSKLLESSSWNGPIVDGGVITACMKMGQKQSLRKNIRRALSIKKS